MPELNPVQFMSRDELASLRSGDFAGKVGTKTVRRQWLTDARREPQGRHQDHGGPEGYLSYLTEDIRQRGVQEPVEVRYHEGFRKPVLYEGHHRAFAALDAGIKRVPYVQGPPIPDRWRR
jgi:hypothetical protein